MDPDEEGSPWSREGGKGDPPPAIVVGGRPLPCPPPPLAANAIMPVGRGGANASAVATMANINGRGGA